MTAPAGARFRRCRGASRFGFPLRATVGVVAAAGSSVGGIALALGPLAIELSGHGLVPVAHLPYHTEMANRTSRARRGRRRVISASEAAKNFGALVDRVREEQAAYVVERSGVPVAQVVPVPRREATLAELVAALRSGPPVDEAFLRDVERGVAFFNRPTVPPDPWAS